MSFEYFFVFILEAILDKAVEAGAVLTLKEYLALNNNDTSVTEVALLCLNAIQDTSNPSFSPLRHLLLLYFGFSKMAVILQLPVAQR